MAVTALELVSQSVRASQTYIELAGVPRTVGSVFIPPCGGLIGQYDPAKTTVVDYTPVRVLSSDDVGNRAGFGSHSHRMALKIPAAVYLQGLGVYWFPVPEAAGTVADETITITGTATSGGTQYYSIGGYLIQVAVASGDAFGVVAAAIVAAITAERDIAVTATATAGVVTVEAKFKGTAGNQILIKVNPSGIAQENKNPAGVTVTLVNADGYLNAGATDPSVEDIFLTSGGLDNLGDRWYTDFNMPYTDAANLAFYKTSGDLRVDPAVRRFFVTHSAYNTISYATALTTPASINSEWIAPSWEDRIEGPAFELSALQMGIALREKNLAPNRPIKTLEVDIQVNSDTQNRSIAQNDALFRAGMTYFNIDTAGTLRLGDVALSYRTNDSGGASEEWFDLVKLTNRQAKVYSIEQVFNAAKYTRAVVVGNDDVTKVTFAIAPKDLIADLTQLITEVWIPYAWSKNGATIIESLSAEINALNNSRIDMEVTDDIAEALRIITFRYAYLI